MTEPAAPPVPQPETQPVPLCDMCIDQLPSGSLVRRVGDDKRYVDMGHVGCYGIVIDEIRQHARAAAAARVS